MTGARASAAFPLPPDWHRIDTVLLDMDGTLLDLRFDNHFWLVHVPRRYAERHGLEFDLARAELLERYRNLEGRLEWYCIDHWSRELGLDIALLKAEVGHLIAMHPGVPECLDRLGALGKRRVLVTNAHPASLALKMRRTGLDARLDRIICAHDLGHPKEAPEFWAALRQVEPFDPARTLLIDDNLEVLRAARDRGLAWLLAILAPDSSRPARPRETADTCAAVEGVAQLLDSLASTRSRVA